VTSTFSAECIKYLSNAFLATCISFTNAIFASINEDEEFEFDSVISGWHADRRFIANKSGIAGITSYLMPGPGFGGSCFPKDVRALRAKIQKSGEDSSLLDAVIHTNQNTLQLTAKWINTQLPSDEKFVLLGMGFKDDTNDTRESPSVALAKEIVKVNANGFWHDKHVSVLPDDLSLNSASKENIDRAKYFILMHHSDYYRDLLTKRASSLGLNENLTVFALRYQEPMPGINWVFPRTQRKMGETNE
jgi:nucleotide sugar dehydrogenase